MLCTPAVAITQEMLGLAAEIDEFKGAWRALGRLAPEPLRQLRTIATIESFGSSTRIEGANLTDLQVEAMLGRLRVKSFSTRDEQEVAGYAVVMDAAFGLRELRGDRRELHQAASRDAVEVFDEGPAIAANPALPIGSSRRSDDLDRIGRHPDIDLLKPFANLFLELREELAVLGRVRHIDERAHQVVAEYLVLVLPQSTNRLRFARDRSEPLAQLKHRVGNRLVRHGAAVVKP